MAALLCCYAACRAAAITWRRTDQSVRAAAPDSRSHATSWWLWRRSPLSIMRGAVTAPAITATLLLAWQPVLALQQPHLFSRRVFGGALTSSLLISIPPAGAAPDADQQTLLIPPPQPVPLPGAGAPLRPLVVADDSWMLPDLSTKLAHSRIATRELAPLVPSLSPFAQNDVYYPKSFAGKWEVKATLRRKMYPYGPSFVPS